MIKWINNFRRKNAGDPNIRDKDSSDSKPNQIDDSAISDKKTISRKDKSRKSDRKPWSLRKKMIVTVTCILAAALCGIGIYIAIIIVDPIGGFETVAKHTLSPAPSATTSADRKSMASMSISACTVYSFVTLNVLMLNSFCYC